MKECTKCHEIKDESEFYKSRNLKSGRTYQCKACMNIQNAEYQRKNKRGRHKGTIKCYISEEVMSMLAEKFINTTGCHFNIPDDVEMAIRILIAR